MRLTAAEAKKISGPTLDEKIDSLLESIQAAATKGCRSIKTGWEHKSDENLWVDGGYEKTPEWKRAKSILEELGYKVEFYYSLGSFSVDMYTIIKW